MHERALKQGDIYVSCTPVKYLLYIKTYVSLYSQDAALDTLAETTHAAAEPRWKLPSGPAPVGVWGRSPDLGVGWKCVSDASAVTEVHLRRLDESDQLHRRVVAVLTVDATPEEVCQEFMTVIIDALYLLWASAKPAHCNKFCSYTRYVKCMLYSFPPSCKHLTVQVNR